MSLINKLFSPINKNNLLSTIDDLQKYEGANINYGNGTGSLEFLLKDPNIGIYALEKIYNETKGGLLGRFADWLFGLDNNGLQSIEANDGCIEYKYKVTHGSFGDYISPSPTEVILKYDKKNNKVIVNVSGDNKGIKTALCKIAKLVPEYAKPSSQNVQSTQTAQPQQPTQQSTIAPPPPSKGP
ncbi:MAG: hypothetical protein QW625_01560 [Candidatus Nanoarchaeia archaeon]